MNVAIIPAKGHSTRLNKKNTYLVYDKPLLYWTVFYARCNHRVHSVIVSTEDEYIAKLAKGMSCTVIPRPIELCGEQPLLDVYTHAYYYMTTSLGMTVDKIIGLQVDNPDRNLRLDDEIKKMDDKGYNLMFSISSDGEPNGAAKIYSKYILTCGRPYYLGVMIDDCTNVHYMEDIERVEDRLRRTWWYERHNQ